MSSTDPLRASAPSPVVVSGPMGSELVERGVRWRGHGMLTDTDAVRALYAEYLEAGCDVLRTNTFQLNRRIYLDVFRDPAKAARMASEPGDPNPPDPEYVTMVIRLMPKRLMKIPSMILCAT